MTPELVYEIDGQRVTYALTGQEATVGRSADNDVVIRNALVSRHHARLFRVGDAWRVSDLGSSNGTRVNDSDPTDRDLRSGDRIGLHKFCILFVDQGASNVSLIPNTGPEPIDLAAGTVIRSAVDFSALAGQTIAPGGQQPEVERLGRLLNIVTKASGALLSSGTLDDALNAVLDLVFEHLNAERGCIMLWDEERQDLRVRCVKPRGGETDEIRFSRTIAEKVYRDKVAILTSDAMSDERFAGGQSIIDLGIRSAMAAPLWNGERVEGLIYADSPIRTKAFDNFDLDVLSAMGNHAAVAIEQFRLQQAITEQQLVRQRLERYHSPAVIEHITARGDAAETLVADELEVTVMFADVVNFTSKCENLEPRQIAELLNRYFSEMAEVVFRHEGTLDKFIGDCLMAVFGAPLPTEDHMLRGALAALEMREALVALNAARPADSRLQFRIGMHSGKVVAGDIGSLRRSDYTVLGSTVNLAARLESTVAQPGQIVISDTTREALRAEFVTRPIGDHRPKGLSRDVTCYELLGRRS